MREIITITGDVGSGKSTVGKIIADSLGFTHISTGAILREIALRRGLTIIQINEALIKEREIDEEIDSHIQRISSEESRLVLDSRMAWYFSKNAFKIYVTVDPNVGAQRVIKDNRSNEVHHDIVDAVKNNLKRKSLEDKRFKRLYGVRCDEFQNFDIVVDSTWVEAIHVANVVFEEYNNKNTLFFKTKGYICPKRLYPTANVRNIAGNKTDEIFNSIKVNGYDKSLQIEIIRFSKYFFIYDGHKRTSCALKLGLHHIPCIIHEKGEETSIRGLKYEEEVIASMRRPWIYDWEAAHSFRFASYPDEQGKPILS